MAKAKEEGKAGGGDRDIKTPIGMLGPGDVSYDEEGFPIVNDRGLPIKAVSE